jgi:penicillin-binding protein 1A
VEQRISVPLDRISPRMIEALLAVEDRRFILIMEWIPFALPLRLAKLPGRADRRGRQHDHSSSRASLSSERTYDRKIREILIAAQLEQRYTKAQILEQPQHGLPR